MNLNDLKPKEWKDKREHLDEMLKEANTALGHTKITRCSDTRIALDGGCVPVIFDIEDKAAVVWNRSGKSTTWEMPIRQLLIIEQICLEWLETYLS